MKVPYWDQFSCWLNYSGVFKEKETALHLKKSHRPVVESGLD